MINQTFNQLKILFLSAYIKYFKFCELNVIKKIVYIFSGYCGVMNSNLKSVIKCLLYIKYKEIKIWSII